MLFKVNFSFFDIQFHVKKKKKLFQIHRDYRIIDRMTKLVFRLYQINVFYNIQILIKKLNQQ